MEIITINSPATDIQTLPQHQQETMCRTITACIRRLLADEKNRADFEQWRKARKEKTA
jgi:hypothetical protein